MTSESFRKLQPSFETFREGFEQGRPQLLYRRTIGDLETPLSAYLKLTGDRPGSFLLESVEGGEQLGRYSTIGMEPDRIWRCKDNQAEYLGADGEVLERGREAIASLRQLIAADRAHMAEAVEQDLPPMASGLFGYFAYDFVRYAERLPDKPEDTLGLPDAYLIRPTVVATFDSVKREVVLVTTARPGEGLSAEDAYRAAETRLDDCLARLRAPLEDTTGERVAAPDFQSNMTPEAYLDAVKRAKDYIAAGDIFQVVLSQRYSAKYDGRPLDAYRQLRRINPSPFLFYLNFEPATLLGASPEILVRVRHGEVTIRPIAGTRPRGRTREEDLALETELLADQKERAEHLMLLDLGRNDVGRSSKLGTVKPTETFVVERYSHVMHITSNVTGELREDLTPLDAMLNGFPAGTLTGAPKIRAMEIIDELEVSARGPYGGAIGYFGADGEFDSCIGLRMAVVKDGEVHIQAGAGVVHDSDPLAELAECEAKSRAIKEAFIKAAEAEL
ncbi:anthranilate synthase component I [Parvularcula lutaonensis]|uniref:Anthranilate synthase component 1 n=1 Tax=Parvularcula lutaonensis TaxID=491923 RepID=A0ABV7MDK9_9PROT|nr:anthranilate synthase component I [Parvularcula lutaonensis]GGY49469.1 anthranilate synthase component I [Parvularcula lutaonensis]